MPRKLRIEYAGAIYHVMSRANGTGNVFLTDVDRQDFLRTLAKACQKTGFQVHAYCLMRNHFHLVVETPNANLVAGMRWLLSAYTLRFNPRHKRFGHVFKCPRDCTRAGGSNAPVSNHPPVPSLPRPRVRVGRAPRGC